MTNRVLVTGALGFIGSSAARYFKRIGADVTGVGRGIAAPGQIKAIGLSRWISGDVSVGTLMACGAQDLIVHCAGGSTVGASNRDPARDLENSVGSFNAVLDYARKACPKARLVYVSSAAVYGSGYAEPIGEDSGLHPMSPYGLHKKFCEEMLKFYGERDGLLGAVVRLFSIYGPGLRKQLLWDAVGKLLSGQAIFFGTGHEVRDWVHIDDTVRLIAIAADHASPKIPVCNGASGVAIPVRDILDLVARTLGVTQFPSFDGVSRLGDPDFLVGSTCAAKSWGWRVETNWRDGIAAYVRWAQNARKL